MNDEAEALVKAFFELNGFLVGRVVAPPTSGPPGKGPKPGPCLRARNLSLLPNEGVPGSTKSFQRFSNDLRELSEALVSLIGFELLSSQKKILPNDRKSFSPLLKLLSSRSTDLFPWEQEPSTDDKLRKWVVIPLIPSGEPLRQDLFQALQNRGVDGVLTLRTILDHLIHRVETVSADQSHAPLRILAILKALDLVKSPQMDLFPS